MRILVVGAGAIGGYFGGRLLQAGRDVTFLVRPRRAAQLAATGLVINSGAGNVHRPHPPALEAHELREPFDVVLLSCKAYDLNSAMDSFAPAVGPGTAILPLLNGMSHLDMLEARFGQDAVLGGHCLISAALDAEGRIQHLNELHSITFGERTGALTERTERILAALSNAGFDVQASESIVHEMWEKWAFIASLAGITCLMRAAVGDVVSAGGRELAVALAHECVEIASAAGYPAREATRQRIHGMVTKEGSTLAASMLRDMERGAQTEGEQILGDLVRRQSPEKSSRSLLRLAYTHVKAYEARRARESAAPSAR